MSFFELSFLSQLIFVCTIIGGVSTILIGAVLAHEMYYLFEFPNSNRRDKEEEDNGGR